MASTKTRVLVAEDDPNIRLGLEEVLRCEDFEVDSCDRGDKVLDCLARRTPDLVVLDVMLPGLNGYEICRKIRERNSTIPILMLTAKGQEIDKVVGFEAGADDYVTKPFGVRELLARINALLRRSQKNTEPAGNGASRETGESFQIGPATIDPKTFQIKRGKTTEPLTAKELKLLQFLHAHPGEVLSRDRLLNEVWGYNYYGTTRTLDQTISQLRKKLGDHGENPRYLLTVHGVGYKLV